MITIPISWMWPWIGWIGLVFCEVVLVLIAHNAFKDARKYNDGFLTIIGATFLTFAIFILVLALTLIGLVGWS